MQQRTQNHLFNFSLLLNSAAMAVTTKPAKFQSEVFEVFSWSTMDPDPDQVRRSSFGLPYRDDNPIDAPAKLHPLFQDELKQILRSAWGVNNADDARRIVERILGPGMHTPIFDAFLQLGEEFVRFHQSSALVGESEKLLNNHILFLEQLFSANGIPPTDAAEYKKWIELRLNPAFTAVLPPTVPQTTRAWDLLRIEAFAGRSVSCGWMEPDEYEDIAARTVRELQASFATWSDVARSFWWGRAMWLCDEIQDIPAELCQFNKILTAALNDKKSPWVRVPLHPGADELEAKL